MTKPFESTSLNQRMLLEIEGKLKGVSSVKRKDTSQESVLKKMKMEMIKSLREVQKNAINATKKVTLQENVLDRMIRWSMKTKSQREKLFVISVINKVIQQKLALKMKQ